MTHLVPIGTNFGVGVKNDKMKYLSIIETFLDSSGQYWRSIPRGHFIDMIHIISPTGRIMTHFPTIGQTRTWTFKIDLQFENIDLIYFLAIKINSER